MAILYGTTGEGQTLPVLVDQFGNLLAKGIKGEPGTPGTQGPQGPQGEEGQEGAPGEGVPLPYGEERSVLYIKDGAPAWSDPIDPPPLPDNPDVNWVNYQTVGNPTNDAGQYVFPPNNLTYLMELDSWLDPSSQSLAGSKQPIESGNDPSNVIELTFKDSFGKVLILYWSIVWRYSQYAGTWSCNVTCDNPDVGLFQMTPQGKAPNSGSNTDHWAAGSSSFMVNRDIQRANFAWSFKQPGASVNYVMFRGFELLDPGKVALDRQIVLEDRMQSLFDARLTQSDSA